MSVDELIKYLAVITLVEMMVTVGLGVTVSQIQYVGRNGRLVLGAILASYILIPLVAWGLVVAFHAPSLAAAGFLMAAVCSGAPSAPHFAKMAKAEASAALGLTAILAALSTVISPLLLYLILQNIPGDQPLKINVVGLVLILFFGQFVPLCAGLAIRRRWADIADKLEVPTMILSVILSLLLITVILSIQRYRLASIQAHGVLSIFLFVIVTFAICWQLGSYIPRQRALAAATSVRNISAGLVLATFTFPGSLAVSSAAVYALCQIALLALLFIAWGKVPSDIRIQSFFRKVHK
jgi:bile acid:Na+ symporter, BASS family